MTLSSLDTKEVVRKRTLEPLKKTILAVDDEPAVLQSLEIILQERYLLIKKEKGEDALQAIRDRRDIDLIILDVRLADTDGLTLYRRIRQVDRVVPILFTSGYGTKELLSQMLEVRANGYIDKPWNVDQLEHKIARLLGADPFERVHEQLNIDFDHLSLKMRRAVQFIDRHYSSPELSLEEIGQAVSLHPKYLSASFKKECGIGFHDYLTAIRIDRAIQLLKDPHRTIKEISCEVGFSEQGYFSKVFFGKMGMPPSDYRTKFNPR
ncbi:MAG: response regulator [Nitrospirae bacterium]|nr:response regulator [Candidatus Manganitrophaceae bacterium]